VGAGACVASAFVAGASVAATDDVVGAAPPQALKTTESATIKETNKVKRFMKSPLNLDVGVIAKSYHAAFAKSLQTLGFNNVPLEISRNVPLWVQDFLESKSTAIIASDETLHSLADKISRPAPTPRPAPPSTSIGLA